MKTAMVFPGQGSQSVGMMAELLASQPVVKQTFEQASDVLGYDMIAMTQTDQAGQLNLTHITQPALLTADVAAYRAYREQGGAAPMMMAGHSLGEYAALVAAEALSFSDALTLVELRGKAMQAAAPKGSGAMAAILGLEDGVVVSLCEQASSDDSRVEAANYNSPGQVVIAGHAAAVETAMVLAKEAGAKRVVELAVSVPSHCFLMKPAAEALAEALVKVDMNSPKIPVLHNVNVQSHVVADDIKTALVNQLFQPVQWTQSVLAMQAAGVDLTLEMGPGKVLTGLSRRIDRRANIFAVWDDASLAEALVQAQSQQ